MSEHFTPPTPADLKARYPEFAAVADARIQAVLDEALLDVNDEWDLGSETASIFRAPAMLALTAHLLSQEGALTGDTVAEGTVQSVSVGDVTTTFAATQQAGSGSGASYMGTRYGERFLELKRLAFPNYVTLTRA